MKKFILKNKQVIAVSSFVIILGIILLLVVINTVIPLSTFRAKLYNVTYDRTWEAKEKNVNENILKLEKDESYIDINMKTLDGANAYKSLYSIIDNLEYVIENENKLYKLIAKENTNISKNKYNAVKYIYENTEQSTNVMLVIIKENDKLVFFNYEAPITVFDIQLDSIENMLYSIEIKEENVELQYKDEKIETTGVVFENANYEINNSKRRELIVANNQYEVKYTVLDSIKEKILDSRNGYLTISKNTDMSVKIVDENIIEYIKDTGINTEIEFFKNQPTLYKDLVITNEKKNSTINTAQYIYRLDYTYLGLEEETKCERVYILTELDYMRTFVIQIDSKDEIIPKEIIDSVKITGISKYGKYLSKKIEDGINTQKMSKIFVGNDNQNERIDVTIKLPEKYFELDKGYNKYETRIFGLNYDKVKGVYKYEINYNIVDRSIADYVELTKKSYDNIKYLQSIRINNIDFEKYTANKDNIKYIILFKRLSENKTFAIQIQTKQDNIRDEIINDVSNIKINSNAI